VADPDDKPLDVGAGLHRRGAGLRPAHVAKHPKQGHGIRHFGASGLAVDRQGALHGVAFALEVPKVLRCKLNLPSPIQGMQHGVRLGMSVQTPGGDHPLGVSGMILPISIAWLAGTS
jgi:hypothetical protein